jgi:hypothetical protein
MLPLSRLLLVGWTLAIALIQMRAHPSRSDRRIAALAASAIELTSNRIEIILMKQMERRSALTLPFPRNWGEGLLKRRAAGGVGDWAGAEILQLHFLYEKQDSCWL